ncbi:transcription factor Sox-3-like [Aquarana catesbeiana]|uniref:transcription factor Sox-3-like n=1 Tax=Aquarana catesbeiana TaxID=8400 RepID=UPI003CC9CCB1
MYTLVETSIKNPVPKPSTQTGGGVPSGVKSNAPKPENMTSTDQPKIKRPMNAFMLWSRQERKKLHETFPKMPNSQISKRLGTDWKLLTDAQRKPFILESKRLCAQHISEYPDYKFTPKKKSQKLQQKGQDSLPGDISAAGVNPTVGSAGVGQRADSPAPMNGWPTGPYAFMQGQLGYMQHLGINRPPFLQMQRYAINGFPYGPMLAATQTFRSSAPIYNIRAPYTQQTSGTMSFGSTAPRTESDSNSSPVSPHPPPIYSADMRDAIRMYLPLNRNVSDPSSVSNQLQNVPQHYQNAGTGNNGMNNAHK